MPTASSGSYAFSNLDWVVLFLYLALSAGLGLFMAGKSKTFKEYMFGAGTMPWFAVGISLIATSVSATTFLGNPADSFANDMSYLMLNIGTFVGIVIVWKVFIPRFKNAGVSSAYELLERTFNRPVRLLASSLYSLHLVLRTGILLYGPSLILAPVLGISVYTAIVVTSVLAVAYTVFGGIRAVIWTDVLQFVVLFGGGITVLLLLASENGGLVELFTQASKAGKTNWLVLGWDPANARNFLSAGLVYVVFEVAIRGCDQQFVQRYLSCKSIHHAGLSSLAGAVMGLMVGLLFFGIGAGLFVQYQGVIPPGLTANDVFPHFIFHGLPAGITGLMVAAIFAAAMSSLDSAITALSNTTIVDFFGKDSRYGDPNVGQARLWVIVWGVVGVGAAILAANQGKSILGTALFFTSLFTGPLLAMFVFAFFRPRTNPTVLLAGVFFGMCTLAFFSKIPIIPQWQPYYSFSWPWNPLLSFCATSFFTFVVDWIIPRKHINITA
jgi:solute:Na+ symporter, SSS family